MKTLYRMLLLGLVTGMIGAVPLRADTPATQATSPSDAAVLAQATADKAFAFLKSQQKPDFSWQNETDPPAMTAIVLRAFMSDPKYDPDETFLDKSFDKLISFQQQNGGIYKDTLAGYNTAIAISALAVSKEAEYKPAIQKAVDYLRSLQWSDQIQGVGKVTSDKDPKYGGFGYGKTGQRPDLSNTQIALDALHDAGVKSDDPAYQAAVKFASRCQNFSETNDQPWAGDDGGFVYTAAEGGQSAAGNIQLGGRLMLRSYGSMTYGGLKSMIYAGLSHDDPRVKAAWGWISKNFTVDENPGMSALGDQFARSGLFYYYYTMSRALTAYGQPVIVDPQGVKHDWRVELINKLASMQRPDGSFVGERKWMEDNPVLVTAYAAIVLETVKADLKDHPVTGN